MEKIKGDTTIPEDEINRTRKQIINHSINEKVVEICFILFIKVVFFNSTDKEDR